jgi:aryl-alcohol dehydrogenase-like predicted oxidoreductase
MNSKIVVGTANFGNQYGIANRGKLLSLDESKAIINWAQENDINQFDTALAYGDAEEILSMYLDQSLAPKIDTKLDTKSCQSSTSIIEAARKTRDRLGVNSLSTLYLHNEDLLQSSSQPEVSAGLREVLHLGIAKQIGVSVYSEAAVLACKKVLPELTVFQVPENICDRRLIDSKHIKGLADEGNSFMVRSIFLQGLLLMDAMSVPSKLHLVQPQLQRLNEIANKQKVKVIDLCLAYAYSISWASGIVIGVASLAQLKEIFASPSSLPEDWASTIKTLPSELLDPRKWPK